MVDAFPRETVAVYDLVKAGEYSKAVEIYRWFMPLLELDIHPKLVQYIKLAATAKEFQHLIHASQIAVDRRGRTTLKKIIADSIATRPQL
jgi:4-hydroxy-tetrahydrodipicolinate synthase